MIKTAENVLNLNKKLYKLFPPADIRIPQKKYEDTKKGSYSISSTTIMNKHLSNLLEYAKNDDYYGVEKTLSDIETEVVKKYSHTGEDWSDIKKILDDIHYANNHFPYRRWRYEKIQDLYKDLHLSLNKHKQEGPLKQVFENLYSELSNTYEDALINENIESLAALKDLARQIRTLDIRVKNERPDLYHIFVNTSKEIARCIPLLIRLQPIEKDGKTKFHKDEVKNVSNNFSEFFSTFDEFISSFEKTPGKHGKEKNKNNNVAENDFKKIDLKRKIENLLYNENWKIEQICRHLSITKEEVIKILKSS